MSLIRPFLCILFLVQIASNAFAQNNFVYTHNGRTVSGYAVGASGALTEIQSSPFQIGGTGGGGSEIEISSVGNFLYISNGDQATISVFGINPNTGALTPVPGSLFGSQTGGFGGLLLEATPNNEFLYAANVVMSKISAFRVAPNGALSILPGFPFTVANPKALKISSDGRFLFVAEDLNPRIDVFSIDSNGGLTRIPGSPFNLGSECDFDFNSMDINCAGTLLFALDDCGFVTVFSIAPNGALTKIADQPVEVGHLGPDSFLLNPVGNLLFVADTGIETVSVFSVDSTGVVSPTPVSSVNIADPENEDKRPVDLSMNREGTLLYVASGDGSLFVFNIGADGSLTSATGLPTQGLFGYGTDIAAYPSRICGPVFDVCIQDDSNGNILQINSSTGEYLFTNCSGFTLTGIGKLVKKGSITTLQHNASDRRLQARIDGSASKATASIQALSQGITFSIIDRNTANNTCSCN